jgi:hypothetical protein
VADVVADLLERAACREHQADVRVSALVECDGFEIGALAPEEGADG